MHKYKVYLSKYHSIIVRAKNVSNARKRAWEQKGHFKYGWDKQDFLENATVQQIS